jgi:hypothetical protein
MSVRLGTTRSADVAALEDSVLWALRASDFDHIVGGSIPLLRALNRSLAARLAMATGVIEQTELVGAHSGPVGLRIGPYRVVAQVGVGGLAVVYSAVREDDGMAVALKVLPASWGAAVELRARLERESSILRSVQHPGIIRLLDIGPVADRLGGGTFIAMKWLSEALDRVLRAQYPEPMPPADAVRTAGGVAEALAAVDRAGLSHRDFKPSNPLLRADGQPVLTDFGLAAGLAEGCHPAAPHAAERAGGDRRLSRPRGHRRGDGGRPRGPVCAGDRPVRNARRLRPVRGSRPVCDAASTPRDGRPATTDDRLADHARRGRASAHAGRSPVSPVHLQVAPTPTVRQRIRHRPIRLAAPHVPGVGWLDVLEPDLGDDWHIVLSYRSCPRERLRERMESPIRRRLHAGARRGTLADIAHG